MKKILVLGSDYGTIDIVREAQKMGLYVIATDLMDTSPTKELADESWKISTTDTDLLIKKIKEQNISGVITGASDFNIRQSRNICKRIGFPIYCSNDFAWEVSTNKRLFKDVCKEVGAPVAQDYYLNDDLKEEDLSKIKYPVVIKPVDKSGNRGMSYCDNKEQLIEGYKKAREISDNPTIVVERKLHGPEFAVNYVIAAGEPQLYFFSSEHSEPGELKNLYSIIDTTSCHLKQYLEQVNDRVIAVFKKIGCTEGVAWVECMLDDDGNFYLLEMGYRFGGEIVNIPYERVSGFNSAKWMIEIALGVQHKISDLPEKLTTAKVGVAASYLLFAKRDGKIGKISGLDEISKLSNVSIDMPKRCGETVRYHATMGNIHINGENINKIVETLRFVNSRLKILDENGEDLFIYFTDYNSLINEYNSGLTEFKQ